MIPDFWQATHQALDFYCMLQERGVTYRRTVTVYGQEPAPMAMVIRTSTHDDVTVSQGNDQAWKLPGGYAHRRGRR